MSEKKQTAVEFLIEQITKHTWYDEEGFGHVSVSVLDIEQAKQMEREQHGNTWDAAIKAHDDRGHVYVRSICDFDDYEVGS
jgi:hypothetical protein